eukprot:scaffold42608_cov150-Skeletonema_dohrnii-CCMP3373.AAC.1
MTRGEQATNNGSAYVDKSYVIHRSKYHDMRFKIHQTISLITHHHKIIPIYVKVLYLRNKQQSNVSDDIALLSTALGNAHTTGLSYR